MMIVARSGAVAALLLVNGLLLAVLGYQWLNLDLEVRNANAALEPEPYELPSTNIEPFAKRAMSDYSAVTSRPLFNRDRLPLPESEEEAGEDAELFSVLGIVLTSEQQVAILYSKTQKQPVKVALWEWIDGWRLIAVEPKRVVLRKGNRTMEMLLKHNSNTESE